MKNLKRALAALLAAALLVLVTACGFGTAMARAVTELKKLKSLHADVVMDIGLRATLSIMSLKHDMDMDAECNISADAMLDPELTRLDMELSLAGVSVPMLVYREKQGEAYNIYTTMDGEHWQTELGKQPKQTASLSLKEQLQFFLACAASFKESGEEEIDGKTARRFDGNIPQDKLVEALQMAGALEQLEALGVTVDELPELTGTMPLSVWIDKKSGLPLRMEMDMSDILSQLGGRIEKDAVTVSITRANVVISLSQFDEIGEIVIPDAARQAVS